MFDEMKKSTTSDTGYHHKKASKNPQVGRAWQGKHTHTQRTITKQKYINNVKYPQLLHSWQFLAINILLDEQTEVAAAWPKIFLHGEVDIVKKINTVTKWG